MSRSTGSRTTTHVHFECVQWHPLLDSLFASATADGTLSYWQPTHRYPCAQALHAHSGRILAMTWHPLGNCLASAGMDSKINIWCGKQPGDTMDDRYNLHALPYERKVRAVDELREAGFVRLLFLFLVFWWSHSQHEQASPYSPRSFHAQQRLLN